VFTIEVFSAPFSASTTDDALTRSDLHLVAEHDEAVLRSAILLADHVRLFTERADRLEGLRARMFAASSLPVPRRSAAFWLSESRDPSSLRQLGLEVDALIPVEELGDLESMDGDEIDNKYGAQIDVINSAVWENLRSEYDALHTEALARLNSSGLVTVERWSSQLLAPPFALYQVESDEYWQGAIGNLLSRVSDTTSGLLLDSQLEGLFAAAGRTQHPSEGELRGAVDLMAMVEGLGDLPIDELIDVRTELAEYLTPFRAFLLKVSHDALAPGATGPERSRELELAWIRDVEPAIRDMRGEVSSATFRRNLLHLDLESLKGLAMGIALTGSMVYYGGSPGLAPLTLAAPALLTAARQTYDERSSARANPVYFIHEVGKRTQKSRKDKRDTP
jgi:hypothetical protein